MTIPIRPSQYVPNRISNERSPTAAAVGICGGGTVGRLPPAGADVAATGMSGGTAVAPGRADNRVDSPQCGHRIVSPTAVAGNSMCPLQDWHNPLRNFFSSTSTCSRSGLLSGIGARFASEGVDWAAVWALAGAVRMIGGIGGGGIGNGFNPAPVPGVSRFGGPHRATPGSLSAPPLSLLVG